MQPWPPRLLSRLGPWLLAVLLVACVHRGAPIPAGEQQSFGTRTFAASYDVTFLAARDALPLLGWSLDFVSPAQGRIATGRQEAGARREVAFGGTTALPLYRQYDVRIVRVDPGHTRVIAIPRMYAGDRDISSQSVWEMSGPQGEHERWRALFAQIELNLASKP